MVSFILWLIEEVRKKEEMRKKHEKYEHSNQQHFLVLRIENSVVVIGNSGDNLTASLNAGRIDAPITTVQISDAQAAELLESLRNMDTKQTAMRIL